MLGENDLTAETKVLQVWIQFAESASFGLQIGSRVTPKPNLHRPTLGLSPLDCRHIVGITRSNSLLSKNAVS